MLIVLVVAAFGILFVLPQAWKQFKAYKANDTGELSLAPCITLAVVGLMMGCSPVLAILGAHDSMMELGIIENNKVDTGIEVQLQETGDSNNPLGFTYNESKYVNIRPEILYPFFLETAPDEEMLEESDAVLNLDEIGTLYRYHSGEGAELLTDGVWVFCKESEADRLENYYEDFESYTYSDEDGKPYDLTPSIMSELTKLSINKEPQDQLGMCYTIECNSSDGLYKGELLIYECDDGWYLMKEDEDGDEVWISIPENLGAQLKEILAK